MESEQSALDLAKASGFDSSGRNAEGRRALAEISSRRYASARIQSAARSPIMMQVRLVLARTMLGMTDAA